MRRQLFNSVYFTAWLRSELLTFSFWFRQSSHCDCACLPYPCRL